MSAPQEVRFRLHLAAHEYEAYYRGAVKEVVVRALDGRNVRFPANILQRFVTHEGISGEFVLRFDAAGKFQSIERVG